MSDLALRKDLIEVELAITWAWTDLMRASDATRPTLRAKLTDLEAQKKLLRDAIRQEKLAKR